MVTEEDKEAERAPEKEDHVWMGFIHGQGVLDVDNPCSSWVVWAVNELEALVKLVAEQGLPLSTNVCRFRNIPETYCSMGRNQHLEADQKDVQPLWAWLKAQRRELGPPFVRALLERFGPAVGVQA